MRDFFAKKKSEILIFVLSLLGGINLRDFAHIQDGA